MKLAKKILPILFFCVVYFSIVAYLYFNYFLTIDDDCGSELVLSNLLHENGGILYKDWMYSTEYRILNTQLIYSILFGLSKNWFTVRILGNVLLFIIVILSVIYLCVQLSLKKYIFLISAVFLIPISRSYYLFFLHGAYLIPHITISILLLAMFIHLHKAENKKTCRILWVGIALLATVAGMGGMRLIFIFGSPLFLTELYQLYLQKNDIKSINGIKGIINYRYVREQLHVFVILCFMCIGLLINKVLIANIYHKGTLLSYSEDLVITKFTFAALENVLCGWLDCFGYHYGIHAISVNTLLDIMPVIIIVSILMILNKMKNCKNHFSDEEALLIRFFIFGVILLSFLFIFTDLYFFERYLLQVSVYSYFIIFMFFDKLNIKSTIKNIVIALFCLYLLGYTAINLFNYSKIDTSSETRKVADVLLEKGYNQGFTCMLSYANNMVEYSNGKIDVRKISYSIDGEWQTLDETFLYREDDEIWLEEISKVNNFDDMNGSIFLIATVPIEHMVDGDILYQSDYTVVYGYKSYEDFVSDINN